MAQFSVKIMRLTGSVLGENQYLTGGLFHDTAPSKNLPAFGGKAGGFSPQNPKKFHTSAVSAQVDTG
jgi:hypothetical protein